MQYWLMKSEPGSYSIDDLEKDKVAPWDGVRNYQARNFMMKDMKEGDLIIFYHSNTNPPGAAGVGKISSKPYPDDTQLDPKSKYYDERASEENPVWFLVDVTFVKKFSRYVPLPEMRKLPELSDMVLLRKGMRLSVQPMEKKHFDLICSLGA